MVDLAHDSLILLLDRAKVLILVILLGIFRVERGQCVRLHLKLLRIDQCSVSSSSIELHVELGEEALVRRYLAGELLGPESALLGL